MPPILEKLEPFRNKILEHIAKDEVVDITTRVLTYSKTDNPPVTERTILDEARKNFTADEIRSRPKTTKTRPEIMIRFDPKKVNTGILTNYHRKIREHGFPCSLSTDNGHTENQYSSHTLCLGLPENSGDANDLAAFTAPLERQLNIHNMQLPKNELLRYITRFPPDRTHIFAKLCENVEQVPSLVEIRNITRSLVNAILVPGEPDAARMSAPLSRLKDILRKLKQSGIPAPENDPMLIDDMNHLFSLAHDYWKSNGSPKPPQTARLFS